jgi:hypothetical protein
VCCCFWRGARRSSPRTFRELGDQLDALRLAARQRRARLAQRQVPEADILQQAQGVMDGRMRSEELHRIVDIHLQQVAHRFATPQHRQRLGIEAPAATGITQHFHVGQKIHLDGLHALAFAGRAASLAGVEGKTAGGVAGDFCLGRPRIDLPDRVPEADVGGGAGTRGLADRRLVDLEHAIDVLDAAHRFDAGELGRPGAAR